jgi:hypothetical protein
MRKALFIILAVVAVSVLGYAFWPEKSITHEPGILCPDEPEQTECEDAATWKADDFTITPLADYDIRALVLRRKNYSGGPESDLSPVDLAVGWGPMSNQAIVDLLDISQTSRFYLWKAKRLPISAKEIGESSANMHIIPADDDVRDALDEVCKGSIVRMRGKLVRVDGSGGFCWISSLKRTDTGNHACELMWVEKLEIEE